jgi:hypothetical protein
MHKYLLVKNTNKGEKDPLYTALGFYLHRHQHPGFSAVAGLPCGHAVARC